MPTLDHWDYKLLGIPKLIECPVMEVMGNDHEPPLLVGPGHISIESRSSMHFVMHAEAPDPGRALEALVLARNNPFHTLKQLRIFATDYDGIHWNCGWVDVKVGEITASRWRLSGEIQAIMTKASGYGVAQNRGLEVIYDRKLNLPDPMPRRREAPTPEGSPHTATVAGVKLEFFQRRDENTTLGIAGASADFHAPYAENWISEPFNILLGQVVYPRLVARNMGDGTAQISLRVVPEHVANHAISSILSATTLPDHQRFWSLYTAILSMVVYARNEAGEPNFQVNTLTHYYQELAQATSGSNWVLCMTLASIIEGVADLMFPACERVSDIDPVMIESLKAHIKEWRGDKHLRGRILGSLARTKTQGVIQSLRSLCEDGALEQSQLETWITVRNQVMHGRLVSPWSTEELELQLKNLIQLVHRLSENYIRETAAAPSDGV